MVDSLILEGDESAKNPPVVNVKWDGLPCVQGWEKGGEHEQPLKNHLYNKNRDGAWRIDVGIEEVRNIAVDESNEEDTVRMGFFALVHILSYPSQHYVGQNEEHRNGDSSSDVSRYSR